GRACRCENSSAYSLRRTPSAAYRVSNSQESVASPVDLAILEALVPRLNRRKKESDSMKECSYERREVPGRRGGGGEGVHSRNRSFTLMYKLRSLFHNIRMTSIIHTDISRKLL
ncbi:unnamed protein product, partial [Brassica rapa subsp. trilocularis]